MGLLTLDDLELASGQQIDVSEKPRYQWYIDQVTLWIEAYTGQSFAFVAEEIQICQTDSRGSVQFPSLHAVLKVEERDNWLGTFSEWVTGGYYFDGVNTIYGLVPHSTYRITVSYGWEEVPADIMGVATQLVMAGTGLEPSASAGLSRYRVGDVEEVYGVTPGADGTAVVTLTGLQRAVIDSYRTIATTWVL